MDKINILIIGFGSIGQRHASILLKKKYTNKVFVFTKKKKLTKGLKKLNSLNDIDTYKIEYIIISNETFKHFAVLNKINKKFKNKKILVEKPLFTKFRKFSSKNSNEIFVAYNLRFHPALRELKEFIKNKKIWYLNVICGSYLPYWRTNINYEDSYSASKLRGGGVLLDLSHELDYVSWIFGLISCRYVEIKKISDLKIKSEDFVKIFGKIKKFDVHLELNYFNKIPQRQIKVDGKNFSLKIDLLKNQNIFLIKNKKSQKIYTIKRNDTYSMQHDDIIINNGKNACKLAEGLKVLKFIKNIKNTANG